MFSNFIGQTYIKQNIETLIQSCSIKNKKLDHMLFIGPGGLGKTTLAKLIANETKTKLIEVLSHNLNDSVLEDIIYTCYEKVILFIDEIHNINSKIEEKLYSIFDFGIFRVPYSIKCSGINMVSHKIIDAKNLTIIGASTNINKLSKPFLSRFTYIFNFIPYTVEDLQKIILNYLDDKDEKIAYEIAKRSRSNARLAIQITKQVNNWRVSYKDKPIEEIFKLIGIDELGLNQNDYRFIKILKDGPKSLETLSVIMGEPKESIQKYYEGYLIEKDIIKITSAGRELTQKGLECAKNL